MIGRLYKAGIGGQAQTTALTLMEISSAADSVTLIERMYVSQSSFDTSENLAVKVQVITTTGTGTDSSADVNPIQIGDAAFGGTFETNCTIEPTYTANAVYVEQGFNVLSGWLWTPASDDEVITLSPSGLVGVMLDVAPSGSMDFHYGCTIREIGG